MTDRFPLRLGRPAYLENGRAGHKKLREGKPKPERESAPGPSRLARLLALAHHFDELIRRGEVKDQAESARLCRVSRARVTQIRRQLFLAPDIRGRVCSGREPMEGTFLSSRLVSRARRP